MNGYCRVRFLAKSWREQGISPFPCRGVQSEKRTWAKYRLRYAYPRYIYLYVRHHTKKERKRERERGESVWKRWGVNGKRRGRCWKKKYFSRRFPVQTHGSAIPYDSRGQLADALDEERSHGDHARFLSFRGYRRYATGITYGWKKNLSARRGDIPR